MSTREEETVAWVLHVPPVGLVRRGGEGRGKGGKGGEEGRGEREERERKKKWKEKNGKNEYQK